MLWSFLLIIIKSRCIYYTLMNICNVLMSKLYALTYKWVVDKFVIVVLPLAPINTPWGANPFPYSVYPTLNSFNVSLTDCV